MRRFFIVLASLAFCTVWPLTIILTSIQFTFLHETFYFDALKSTNTYERVTEIGFKNADTTSFSKAFPGDPALASAIQTALIQAVTPEWLQSQTETVVSGFIHLISIPGSTVGDLDATISLSEPKAALLPILQSANQGTLDASSPDWLQLFNAQLPDEIPLKYIIGAAVNNESLFTNSTTMQLPGNEFFATENVKILDKQLASVQNGFAFLKLLTYGCAAFLLVCVSLHVLLPKGIASKLKSVGVTLWIASVGTAISAGIMFVSHTFIVEGIMEQVPLSNQWQLVLQDIINTLLTNYSIYLLWPSVIGLLLGIGLHVLSKFMRTIQ